MILRLFLLPVIWFFRFILQRDKLSRAKTVDIDATLDEVKAVFGDPVEDPFGPSTDDEEKKEEEEEGEVHWFDNGLFHQARCCFRDGRLWRITYWSSYSHPGPDLAFIMTRYGQGKKWQDTNPGYMYWREDRELMIGCSAIPAIIVQKLSFPPTSVENPGPLPASDGSNGGA